MIAGFDAVDLELLDDAERSYSQTTVDSDLAHALVTDRPGSVTFAFQGTRPRRVSDLYTDASAGVTVTLPGIPGPIAASFWRSLCSVAWRLVPMALDAQARGAAIRATGHSKGGAEAQAFALMLALIGVRPARLTLWEPARALGPEALAVIADVPGIATRNGADPIPALPPWLGQRPLSQLGPARFTLDQIGAIRDDHGIAEVRTAVLAEIGPAAA